MTRFGRSLIALLAATTALGGCNERKVPTGQVIANVDGREITLADFDAEARAQRITADPKAKSPERDRILNAIVARVLLAEAARKAQVDENPRVVADFLRDSEMNLARNYAIRAVGAAKPISDAEAEAFMAANPQMFAERKALRLDQIQFAVTPLVGPERIKGLKTIDAFADMLDNRGVPFKRAQPTIDSAQVPRQLVALLLRNQGGEPIYFQNGGGVFVQTLTAATPVALSHEDMLAAAKQTLTAGLQAGAVDRTIETLEKAATITWKDGYKPAPRPKAPPAPKPAPAPTATGRAPKAQTNAPAYGGRVAGAPVAAGGGFGAGGGRAPGAPGAQGSEFGERTATGRSADRQAAPQSEFGARRPTPTPTPTNR